jgi:hypothetical protein
MEQQLTQLPENPKVNNTNHAIKYGLVFAIGMIIIDLITLILMAMEIRPRGITWLMIVFILLTVFIANRNYRDVLNQGFLSLGQAVGIGFKIALSGGLIFAIYSFIKSYYFVDMVEVTERQLIEEMERKGRELSEEEMAMALKMASMLSTPFVLSLVSLVFSMFWCSLIGLITGLFLKKE